MDEQIVELLRDKIDRVDAKVDEVKGDVKDIREDVKEMLAYRNQIVGGAFVISLLVSIGFQVLMAVWGK